MTAFDKFDKNEKTIRTTIEVEDSLYDELKMLTKEFYDTSVNKLIDASIDYLAKTENIQLYKNTFSTKRSLKIRESVFYKLINLKDKFGIPLYKLTNMAIRNAINEYKNKDKQ